MKATQNKEEWPDLVKLNVGGRRFMTSFSTLYNKGDNFLTHLVEHHKRGDISVRTDDKGYIFIDRNGDVFQVVLDFLRTNEFFLTASISERQVLCELDFYQIKRENNGLATALHRWHEAAHTFLKKHGVGITNYLVKQLEQGNANPTLRVVEYIRYKQPHPFSWDIDSSFTADECINFGKTAFQKELAKIWAVQGLRVEFSIQSDSYSLSHICTFSTV